MTKTKPRIGLSTGTLVNSLPVEKILDFYREINCKIIEISHSHVFSVTPSLISGFDYISVHDSPRRHYGDDMRSKEKLKKLESKCKELSVSRVVIHPNLVNDWTVLKKYEIPWGIENLDSRNTTGTTIEEMRSLIKKTGFGLVIDYNHCYTHDPTMKLAWDFRHALSDSIKEQHISGYKDPTLKGRHLPLSDTGQIEILDIIDCSIPIIIEIDTGSRKIVEKEFLYVNHYLENGERK